MAKRVKGGSKTRTKIVTKTRRIYEGAKRKARRIKRAAGERMTPMDVVLAVSGAGVGSIGGSIAIAKMPAGIPDVAKNGVLAALGGFLAYKGIKKKNRLVMGLGMGAAAAAATNLISGAVSGTLLNGGTSRRALNAPYVALNAPYVALNGNNVTHTLQAPLDVEEM